MSIREGTSECSVPNRPIHLPNPTSLRLLGGRIGTLGVRYNHHKRTPHIREIMGRPVRVNSPSPEELLAEKLRRKGALCLYGNELSTVRQRTDFNHSVSPILWSGVAVARSSRRLPPPILVCRE